MTEQNPLINRKALPDFDAIKPEHFMPAIERAAAGVEKKVAAMKASTEEPNFKNTILPFESLFSEMRDIGNVLNNLASNAYTKEIGAVQKAVSLKWSALSNAVFQDPVLGARFRAVYDSRDTLALDKDDKAVLRKLYNVFEASGALLSAEEQAEVRAIDAKLITLTQKFKEYLQDAPAQQAVLITDPAELAGLSASEIEGLAENARKKGHASGWLFIPERLMVDEWLERAEHPGFRKKIDEAMDRVGTEPPYDTRPLIDDIMRERDKLAELLGYDHYAEYARSRAMIKDLGVVRQMLQDMQDELLPKFEEDMRALEKFAAENGGPAKLAPTDVLYWSTRQRDALYNFDTADFENHMPLDSIMDGLFNEAQELFGLSFRENTAYAKASPDIRTYDVTDKDGKAVGILHIDMFARPENKQGGAWMNQIQYKTEGHPNVVILNMNIAKPAAGAKAVIGLSQYITLYHEMGHALHGLLGTQVKYASLQGTATPSDYVEILSMINERRALLRENIEKYAVHVSTGKPVSKEQIDALLKSKSHFEHLGILRLVQNSLRDLEIHSMDPADYKGVEAVHDAVRIDSPYADHLRPYPLTRFSHLFTGSSYAAGYVNYLIANVHAADGFVPFLKKPYGNKDAASRLDHLYGRGAGGDQADEYREYRGQDATADALLRELGINDNAIEKPAAKAVKKPPSV